jgi:hypothetical protein
MPISKESRSAARGQTVGAALVRVVAHVPVAAIHAVRALVDLGNARAEVGPAMIGRVAHVPVVIVVRARVDKAVHVVRMIVVRAAMIGGFAATIGAMIFRQSSRRRCVSIFCPSPRQSLLSRSRSAHPIAHSHSSERAAFFSSVPSGIARALHR